MRLKLNVLGITVCVILCSSIFTIPVSYARDTKGTAYVFVGTAIHRENTPGFKQIIQEIGPEHIDFDFHQGRIVMGVRRTQSFFAQPTFEAGIGVASPIPLPILSHFRVQMSYSVRSHPPYITGAKFNLYYNLFKVFNITPYVGAGVGYINNLRLWGWDGDDRMTSRSLHSTLLYTGGLNFKLQRTPLSLFVEYSHGVWGKLAPLDQYRGYYPEQPIFGKYRRFDEFFNTIRAGIIFHFY